MFFAQRRTHHVHLRRVVTLHHVMILMLDHPIFTLCAGMTVVGSYRHLTLDKQPAKRHQQHQKMPLNKA